MSEELKKERSEQFDEKFYDIDCPGFSEHTVKCAEYKNIKQFISFLLAKQQEEFVKMIEAIEIVDSSDPYARQCEIELKEKVIEILKAS